MSAAVLGLGIVGCGGGSTNPTTTPPTSKIAKRAFVSNGVDGTVHIVDADKDVEGGPAIAVGGLPGQMTLTSDKKLTLVSNPGNNSVGVVINQSEQSAGAIPLPNFSDSFAVLPDGNTAFAAVRNSGVVEVLDLAGLTITATVNVATARRLVLSHSGSKLLVFSDEVDTLTVIDTATAKTSPSTAATTIASGSFSRPAWGVFSGDDSKAFILSCGAECGGSSASVTVLDMASNTAGTTVPVSAATMGLLNGTTLYVAGSPPGADCTGGGTTTATSCGRLDVVDTGAMNVTQSGVVITDGFHDHMALASNSRLYVGARTCTNINTPGETRGCLTIFNTSGLTAKVPAVSGDVTGIQPISGRTVVYVVEGGELWIFDTTTDALQATQVDIVGKAVDVKQVD